MDEYKRFYKGLPKPADHVIKLYHSGDKIRGFVRKAAARGEDDAIFPGEEMEPEAAFRFAKSHSHDGSIWIEMAKGWSGTTDGGTLPIEKIRRWGLNPPLQTLHLFYLGAALVENDPLPSMDAPAITGQASGQQIRHVGATEDSTSNLIGRGVFLDRDRCAQVAELRAPQAWKK